MCALFRNQMSGRLLQSWCYLWLLVEVVELVLAGRFSPVTQDVGLQNGQMAAFADFNADKATDILVLNRTTGKIIHHLGYWYDIRSGGS